MKVWNYVEQGDGFFVSTHLTEKGCLVYTLEAILEVLDFEDQEGYERYVIDNNPYSSEPDPPRKDIFPIDQTRTIKELWSIYDYLSEYTWDIPNVDIGIHSSNIKA